MYMREYQSTISVIIRCESHQQCLETTKLARKLCEAWKYVGVGFIEHKSARKGPVLGRELIIYQKSYAHDIIIFKESLRCALLRFICMGIVKITDKGVIPIENNIE